MLAALSCRTCVLTSDLGAYHEFSRIDLYPGAVGFGFPVDFTIQVSNTNTAGSWTTIVTRTAYGQPGNAAQNFPVIGGGRYVKVEATKLRLAGSFYRFQLAEIAVY